VSSDKFEMNESSYKLDKGELRLLLTGKEELVNSSESPIFSMLVRAKADVEVLEAINVDEGLMRSEAYSANLEIQQISLTTRIDGEESTDVDYAYEVLQNEPNPWMTTTTIVFTVPRTESGRMNILDMNGKVIKSIEQVFTKGENAIVLDRNDITSGGVYYYEVVSGDVRMMKKMIVIQ
jgi:hypothetical protein